MAVLTTHSTLGFARGLLSRDLLCSFLRRHNWSLDSSLTQVLVVHVPDNPFSHRISARSISANTHFYRNMREALDRELVSILFCESPIPKFMRRVEMCVINDDLQPSLHRLCDKLGLPTNDPAFAVYALGTKSLADFVLVGADSPSLPVPVQRGQFLLCPSCLTGSRETTQKI
jgi:hypothetical protein